VKKLVGLLLCLSLSLLIVAGVAKPSHTPVSQKEIRPKESYAESESFDMSDAEQGEVATEENTGGEVTSDDHDNNGDASDDEGEAINGDDGGEAPGDDNTGDDTTADDGGGDNGDDEGGGDEGE
jgi:hypothetical protein